MKHRKTVTVAVRTANGGNSHKSTGPTTEVGKSHSSRNALRHSILARKLGLDEHQAKKYGRMLHDWSEHYQPVGKLEWSLVQEITILQLKLQLTQRIEMSELLLRQEDPRDQISGVFHGDLKPPLSDWDLPLGGGWDCERLIVRAIAGDDDGNSNASRGPTMVSGRVLKELQTSQNFDHQKGRHLEVEITLGKVLEKMTRYRSALKRELYQAIEMLRSLQAERREREETREREGGES